MLVTHGLQIMGVAKRTWTAGRAWWHTHTCAGAPICTGGGTWMGGLPRPPPWRSSLTCAEDLREDWLLCDDLRVDLTLGFFFFLRAVFALACLGFFALPGGFGGLPRRLERSGMCGAAESATGANGENKRSSKRAIDAAAKHRPSTALEERHGRTEGRGTGRVVHQWFK